MLAVDIILCIIIYCKAKKEKNPNYHQTNLIFSMTESVIASAVISRKNLILSMKNHHPFYLYPPPTHTHNVDGEQQQQQKKI